MKILQLNVLSGKKQVTEIYLVSMFQRQTVLNNYLLTCLFIYFIYYMTYKHTVRLFFKKSRSD